MKKLLVITLLLLLSATDLNGMRTRPRHSAPSFDDLLHVCQTSKNDTCLVKAMLYAQISQDPHHVLVKSLPDWLIKTLKKSPTHPEMKLWLSRNDYALGWHWQSCQLAVATADGDLLIYRCKDVHCRNQFDNMFVGPTQIAWLDKHHLICADAGHLHMLLFEEDGTLSPIEQIDLDCSVKQLIIKPEASACALLFKNGTIAIAHFHTTTRELLAWHHVTNKRKADELTDTPEAKRMCLDKENEREKRKPDDETASGYPDKKRKKTADVSRKRTFCDLQSEKDPVLLDCEPDVPDLDPLDIDEIFDLPDDYQWHWESPTGSSVMKIIAECPEHIAWSPDGLSIYAATSEQKINRYNIETGQCMELFNAGYVPCALYSFTCNGSEFLALCDCDKKVDVYIKESRGLLAPFDLERLTLMQQIHVKTFTLGRSAQDFGGLFNRFVEKHLGNEVMQMTSSFFMMYPSKYPPAIS